MKMLVVASLSRSLLEHRMQRQTIFKHSPLTRATTISMIRDPISLRP